nr:integrase, catalytic region, zinc finger, CCHC-type, peptidase aspartic, catalytic [Tanacetum cinerariifolium]
MTHNPINERYVLVSSEMLLQEAFEIEAAKQYSNASLKSQVELFFFYKDPFIESHKMSTMSSHEHSLADAGFETRPPMLERVSYIPWGNRFRRYLNYQPERDQTKDDFTSDDLKQYEADIEAMNLILISIPNDINNSMNSCKTAKDMWHSDGQEDSLTLAMMLLAPAITQHYSTTTNNRLRTSSNTRNQAVNDFLLADVAQIEEIEELSVRPEFNKRPLILIRGQAMILHSSMSDIIFDDPNVAISDGNVEHNKNAHDQHDNELELLARNAYKEAEKQLILAKKVTLILDYLHTIFKTIQTEFPEELKVMMDVFVSMESDLDETLRQNEILNDRLLEAILKHDVEHNVLMCSDSMNENLNDEIEKHTTGNLKLLKYFIKKFIGTVCFVNDHFAAITGYVDYVHGNVTICHVYYVEGLGYNLFSVGQFYHDDFEVAFQFKTYYVRNLKGDDLLTGACESNLYTIFISHMAPSSPVCLMSKATSTKSWLWHRRISHLNFGKSKNTTLQPKLVPSTHTKLN